MIGLIDALPAWAELLIGVLCLSVLLVVVLLLNKRGERTVARDRRDARLARRAARRERRALAEQAECERIAQMSPETRETYFRNLGQPSSPF